MINIGMRLFELFDNLLEYDHQITLTKQGPQLKVAYDKNEFDSSLAGGEVESSEILTRLEQMDPTVNKMYMLWIVRQYMNSKMRLEDYPQVFGGLEAFHKAKPRLPVEQRDINRFDLSQLYELVDSFSDTQQEPSNDTKLNRDDVEVIYNGPLGTIAIPKTEEASCELGSGTKWCTASKQNNRFRSYSNAPLYIFQAPGGAKYQFSGKPGTPSGDLYYDEEFPPWGSNHDQFSLFMSGFDDGVNSEWILEDIKLAEVADSHDRYLGDEEIKELYAKNPVLQKYLPLPKIDLGIIEQYFKEFIKDFYLKSSYIPRSVEHHLMAYEKNFGTYQLERDINFEKQVLEVSLNRLKAFLINPGDKIWTYAFEATVDVMLGLGWYQEATGMKTWPELEKALLKALKLWHSKDPDNFATLYASGTRKDGSPFHEPFYQANEKNRTDTREFLATMPSVTKYLKSIGLSKAA